MNRDFESYMQGHVRPIDTQGRYEQKLRATLRSLPQRRSARFASRRMWRMAVVFAALCALAVGGVAYGVGRGVLNFNQDFGWGTPIVSQKGAEELVVAGTLAHASFEHVDVDVIEAVCDGTELRVVYALTDKSGDVTLEYEGAEFTAPGAEMDGVHMCDYVRVNGQDAFFDDIYEAAGEGTNQVLYYLQTNLAAWGVDVSDADTLTIGLPLLPREEGSRVQPTLDFTIPAAVPDDLVREAMLAKETEGIRIAKASFSPVRGYVELEISGAAMAGRKGTSWCRVAAADGARMECHTVLFKEAADGGLRAGFAMMPPEGEWPERIVLTVEMCAPDADLDVEIEIAKEK